MASNFSDQSYIESRFIDEKFRFNNLVEFKSYKHNETGLTVNFADVSGSLYTMAVVIPVLIYLSSLYPLTHTLSLSPFFFILF